MWPRVSYVLKPVIHSFVFNLWKNTAYVLQYNCTTHHIPGINFEAIMLYNLIYLHNCFVSCRTGESLPEFGLAETNVTVQREGTAFLDCPVKTAGDRPVSYPLVGISLSWQLSFILFSQDSWGPSGQLSTCGYQPFLTAFLYTVQSRQLGTVRSAIHW